MKKESLDFFFENFFSDKWFMSIQNIYDINSHELVGGELLQVEYQLPIAVVYLFEGLLLFTVIGSELFLSYRLRRRVAV